MSEEIRPNEPAEKTDDMIEEMELSQAFCSMMRHGSVAMALCIAIAGGYFAQEFGKIYFLIGLAAALVVGGGMYMLGSLSRFWAGRLKKKFEDQ